MLKEVSLLSRLHHENIVRYHHAWIESKKLSTFGIPTAGLFSLANADLPEVPEVPCLFILMELANGGNLEDYIEIRLDEFETLGDVLPNLTKEKIMKFGIDKLRALAVSRTLKETDSLAADKRHKGTPLECGRLISH